VSISLDRVSIPMEEPRKRKPGRPRKNAPKKPISRVYRMAYCGTVTLVDKDGEAVHTIRYGRMPAGDCIGLVEGMCSDVLAMSRQKPELDVTLLADGAPEMWNLLDSQFEKHLGERGIVRLIDLYHLLEKLGTAARTIHGEDAGKGVLSKWRLRLLNSEGAALSILGELQALDERTRTREEVHAAITYLKNNHQRMDYKTARAQGRPVGSGPVEATCKSLFAVRMKRPGARWKETTGAEVVHLRAQALSDRWDDAITVTLAPLRRAVQAV